MAIKILFLAGLLALFCSQGAEACTDDSDCSNWLESQVCCRPRYSSNECDNNCLGKSCYINDDCGSQGEYCCNNFCRESCVGYSCILDSDCGGDDEYCCDYTCQKGTCGFAAWVITLIVLGILGGVATIVGIVLCVYCSQRRRSPGLVINAAPIARVPTTTVVANSNYVQGP